ncbi:hypothetical protein [Ensifer canadensis]
MSDEIDLNNLGPLPEPPRKKGRRRRIVTEEERANKTSPENLERLRKIGFQKGREKTGGRVATPKETKEWVAGKSRDVAEFMYEVMNDDAQPIKERIRAAQWLGEMSMSKAPSEQKVEVNHVYDVNAMLLEAQRMASAKLIDITPKPLSIEGETDV